MQTGSEILTGGWWEWIPQSLDQWDRHAYESLLVWVPASVSAVLQRLTESPIVVICFVLSLLCLIFWRKMVWRYNFLVGLGLVVFLDFLIDSWLKHAFGRIKPYISTQYTPSHHAALSFPSAHAANFGLMAAYLWHYRYVAIFLAFSGVVVSALRVLSGRHYPLDVIGGLILGAFVGWVCRWITLWLKSRYFVK